MAAPAERGLKKEIDPCLKLAEKILESANALGLNYDPSIARYDAILILDHFQTPFEDGQGKKIRRNRLVPLEDGYQLLNEVPPVSFIAVEGGNYGGEHDRDYSIKLIATPGGLFNSEEHQGQNLFHSQVILIAEVPKSFPGGIPNLTFPKGKPHSRIIGANWKFVLDGTVCSLPRTK
ncbi:hypothetical protein C4559_03620 [Candidatus Microgenomates bacterium]|nr:MAG: hypothetical protein C4559_03620 [Candidatus Microgenomates bacterium]